MTVSSADCAHQVAEATREAHTVIAREEIEAFVARVVAEFRPERVVLFGSYARGTATPDSDVDLLIVLPFKGKGWQVASEIRRRARLTFPTDLLVRTPEQVRERTSDHGAFSSEILREGEMLYEDRDGESGGRGHGRAVDPLRSH